MKENVTRTKSTITAKDIKLPPSWRKPDNDSGDIPNQSQFISLKANHIITVVRDPQHTLGKGFTLNPDSTVSKKSTVSVSLGIAVMHQVNTHEDLADLLKKVGDNPHAAIINASFVGIEIGEEFIILSEREIEKQIGIPRTDREKQKGVHNITYSGQSYKAIGRFKENVRPSSWQYFDRDIDKHTPEKFAIMSFEEWKSALGEMLQGIRNISYCHISSTSARVCRNGIPVGGGNGHVWIKVDDPDDIERFRTAILICAAQAGLTWRKPRYSRNEHDKVVGHSLTTIIDTSVFTLGRLVFVGKPTVSDGLTVDPLSASIHIGESDALNTALVCLPDAQSIRDITGKAGVVMDVNTGRNGLRVTASDLTLDTEIETENQGILTVKAIVEQGITGKIRCQTPFRESSSFAAFIRISSEGKPFVYDAGTGITHWLNDFESDNLASTTEAEQNCIANEIIDRSVPAKLDALDPLTAIQQRFALIHMGGKLCVIDGMSLNACTEKGVAKPLVVYNRSDGALLIERFLRKAYPLPDSHQIVKEFFMHPQTVCYDGVDFNPKGTSERYLNLYVGATVIPRKGEWNLIHAFLADVICNGDESCFRYLLCFLAHALQRPEEKPGVMVILLGGQGIGKGTFGRICQKIWSATFVQVNNIDAVIGNFNAILERAFFVFMDEALFSGNRRATDELKSLVTESSFLINEKYQPSRQISSFHRFIAATNADHFKNTERDDRRDFTLKVSEAHKGDHAYWKALNHEIDNGGVEALSNDLLAMDLSDFNVRDKPNTPELLEQKLQSLDAVARWWHDCLDRGDVDGCEKWPEFIATQDAITGIVDIAGGRLYQKPAAMNVSKMMQKLCPSARSKQRNTSLGRHRGFALPSLQQARTEFEQYIGGAVKWPEEQ